jgi:LysR family transcriptional regulator, regulator for bpeEF and oprC
VDQLEGMRLFARVVESGGFSSVARAMRITQPTVSKRIAALESRLGTQLLRRTSRNLSLTEAGREYYQSAVRLLSELEAVESRVGRGQTAPTGLLRVSLPAGVARLHLLPLLPAFQARYPEIELDIDVSDRFVNLVEEGFDLAVRIGALADSTVIARQLGVSPRVTVATPAFLVREGEPERPADLERFSCLPFTSQGAARPWIFNGPEGRMVLHPRGRVRTNDAESIRTMVLADAGIAHAAAWLFSSELASGAVRTVLGEYVGEPAAISIVYPDRRGLTTRARALIDFLVEAAAVCPFLAGP